MEMNPGEVAQESLKIPSVTLISPYLRHLHSISFNTGKLLLSDLPKYTLENQISHVSKRKKLLTDIILWVRVNNALNDYLKLRSTSLK
jgi:hypothetical protein